MWTFTASNSNRVLEHAYLNSLFQTGLKNLLDRAVIDRAERARPARSGQDLVEGWTKSRSTSCAGACRSC